MTERELLKRFVEWMPDLNVAVVDPTMPSIELHWRIPHLHRKRGWNGVVDFEAIGHDQADVSWLKAFYQTARAMLGYDQFEFRALDAPAPLPTEAPAKRMIPSVIKGNYPLYVPMEQEEDDETDRFEATALRHLGGSITFVSMKGKGRKGFIRYEHVEIPDVDPGSAARSGHQKTGEHLPPPATYITEATP